MGQVFGFALIFANASDGIRYIDSINKILSIKSYEGEDMLCRYNYDPKGYAVLV